MFTVMELRKKFFDDNYESEDLKELKKKVENTINSAAAKHEESVLIDYIKTEKNLVAIREWLEDLDYGVSLWDKEKKILFVYWDKEYIDLMSELAHDYSVK